MDTRKLSKKQNNIKEKTAGFSVKWYWATGTFFLVSALLLQLAARQVSGFGEWYALTIYPVLVFVIGGLSGLVPFSIVEWGLYSLILLCFYFLISYIRRGGLAKLCSRLFLILSFLAFSYTINCGINYYRRPFSFYLALAVQDSPVKELESLCLFLSEQVTDSAKELLDEWGSLLPDRQTCGHFPHQAKQDMEKLGEKYPQLSQHYPVPKPISVSEILSVQSLSGIYSPFTIEANYNQDMTPYNIPHTACHELSHLKGFMREDEANFIGYLACVDSESAYSRYSGYLSGFIYVNNALFRQNPELASQIYASLPQEVLEDLQANHAFWKQYEGKVSETATKVNDTYLKVNRQTDGVKSYGRVVDLLLAYYRDRVK